MSSSLSQLVFWSMEHFNSIYSWLRIALLVMGSSILQDLGDVSDTKMKFATSTFLFVPLVDADVSSCRGMEGVVVEISEQLSGWHIGWLSGWHIGWLSGWHIGWLSGWHIGWLSGWHIGWLSGWCIGILGGILGGVVAGISGGLVAGVLAYWVAYWVV